MLPLMKYSPLISINPSVNNPEISYSLFVVPDSIDAHNDEVAQLFMGEGQS